MRQLWSNSLLSTLFLLISCDAFTSSMQIALRSKVEASTIAELPPSVKRRTNSPSTASKHQRDTKNDKSKLSKTKSKQSTPVEDYMDHAYVQHALLTKRQEQELGKAIQRANQLCQRVHALVLEKRYSFGEDELARVATHDNTDEQRQQGTYVVLASEQRRIRIEQPQHRDILARRIQLLTEQDIRDGLGLDGGHVEVNNIVRRGALAREELILCNLRLVVSIAQLFAKRGGRNDYIDGWNRPSLEEAIQEGILGLTTAVERYEPLRNLKFSTYATWWIMDSVRKCFQSSMTGSIRLPTNYHIALSKYGKLVKKYYQIEGRVPSLEKLADEIGISVSKLQLILTLTRGLASTDAPIRNGQNTGTDKYATSSLSETLVEPGLSPNEIVDLSFLRQSLENAMATELSPHERDVIRLRLGLDDGKGLTVKQVVNEFGGAVSVSEIRGMEARALKKLRAPNLDIKYNLREYMDLAGIDKSTMRFR